MKVEVCAISSSTLLLWRNGCGSGPVDAQKDVMKERGCESK